MASPGTSLQAMRTAVPLVHSITNYVAMTPMANILLAVGASPVMMHANEEASEFAAVASALTVNIGTLSPDWVEAMEHAASAANAAGKAWALVLVDFVTDGTRSAHIGNGMEMMAAVTAMGCDRRCTGLLWCGR